MDGEQQIVNNQSNDENNNTENLPCEAPEDAALVEAQRNRANLEAALKKDDNVWGYSKAGLESKKAAMTMLSTKHGMYARIPLTCKGDECPYKDSCHLLGYNLAPVGEFCPIETAQIETRYVAYASEFKLTEESFTDRNLVAEIINLDIMIERCKALIAKEGVPVVDVVAGLSEQGDPIYRPEVSKYWEAYERANKRRNEIYQLMMATRHDKKGDVNQEKSITEIIADVIDVEKNGGFVIDQRPDNLKEGSK
jgi:hypothetical protein